MPPKKTVQNSSKADKKKRKAKSPLCNDSLCTACQGQSEQTKDTQVRCIHAVLNKRPVCDDQFASPYSINFNNNSLQNTPENFANQHNNTMASPNQYNYGYPVAPQAQLQFTTPTNAALQQPPWVSQLFEEIRAIKETASSTEKTVNMINMKVTDIETKMTQLESKVNAVEISCEFLNSEYEKQRVEARDVGEKMKAIKKSSEELQRSQNELEKQRYELSGKLLDLEMRSMNENLVFYGIPERMDTNAGREEEDCENLVRNFIHSVLGLEDKEMKLDRVHRLGTNKAKKPRAMIAKFHDYKDREKVRQKSYEETVKQKMKKENVGVSTQKPQTTREARRAFNGIIGEMKSQNRRVRQQGYKLFVDGKIHKIYSDGQVVDPPKFMTDNKT